jgi:hypothetical protein
MRDFDIRGCVQPRRREMMRRPHPRSPDQELARIGLAELDQSAEIVKAERGVREQNERGNCNHRNR